MTNELSKVISGVVAKRLSNVEINRDRSNQHEFRSQKFANILGETRRYFEGKLIYLDDNPDETIIEDGTFSFYDTRENQPHRSSEFAVYYPENSVVRKANADDLLIICRTTNDNLLLIITENGSTSEQQMLWLFGLRELGHQYFAKDIVSSNIELDFSSKMILETLGIEIQEEVPDFLPKLLELFGDGFPKTSIFSKYARSTLVGEVSPIEEPDKTLVLWLEREEVLFKTLEREFVSRRLEQGFGGDGLDVDEFVGYSLSVHNRRKSRAGHSFENHLAAIFDENKVQFSKGAKTERNNKPDFIFPGIEFYLDFSFDPEKLTMLGVKTTAKDRWRQVLSEAERIQNKHLITLEPAISENQTNEMAEQNLQLIIPKPIWPSYLENQQEYLIDLSDFLTLVQDRQK